MLTAVATLPVLFHWRAPAPHLGVDKIFRFGAVYGIIAGLFYAIYLRERREGRGQAVRLLFVLLFATVFVNHLHSITVDHGPNYAGGAQSNTDYQIGMENAVVNLDPVALPHSYRFLPNGFVRWLQIFHIAFEPARDIYRTIFVLLTFYALYRYARFFTNRNGGFAAVLLVAVIYPVSFEYYAGQLTDPMSHLSFLLAFICLELDDFPAFLTAILIGSLAKETVLAMAGYYALTHWRGRRNVFKNVVLLALTLIVYAGVRMAVLHGQVHYKQISGTDASNFVYNLKEKPWVLVFILTAGALSPTLVLNWKRTPGQLKGLAFYLLPVLFLSNAAFSCLNESRNFMPLVFVMAVIAGRYLCGPPDTSVLHSQTQSQSEVALSEA